MPVEIERKFLVQNDSWRAATDDPGIRMMQGYLSVKGARCTVRIRVAGADAWLTIKGPREGASRAEYEYPIPIAHATAMLDELREGPAIDKTRYLVDYEGVTFEIDEFHGENAGLIVAEIELDDEQQAFALPPWLGAEVTADPRYYNSSLARNPYAQWEPAQTRNC